MVSVMNNNDFELDRKNDLIGNEPQSEARVLGHGDISSSFNPVSGCEDKRSSAKSIGSEENGVSEGGFSGNPDKHMYGGIGEDKSLDMLGSGESKISPELERRASKSDGDELSVGGHIVAADNGGGKSRVSEVAWEGVAETMKSGAHAIPEELENDHKMGSKGSRYEKSLSRVDDGLSSEGRQLVELTPKASDSKDRVRSSGLRVGKGHLEVAKHASASNEKHKAMGAALSSSVGYGYEIGDMVWGKVKSHPWWPGFIYNESFASPSVQRTKRAGHVLVAFFGDSSYGWFDPSELIPFDSNFSEKIKQLNSRTFAKAVEEAIDEASRRSAMGLACRCRNPYNFRQTHVRGYLAVDVVDYEPGVVYSANQIAKARDRFKPFDTLDFMKQLALMPTSDLQNIDFLKNKATILAYRKAVFEEFDETYAQAFGVQPVRPSREPVEATAQPIRAPLSGPMVIAEALGKKKKSAKPHKAKDQSNKDRYLFKRREEPGELEIQQIAQVTSFTQPAFVDPSIELGAGDYVLQKRVSSACTKQQNSAKLEHNVTVEMDGGSVSSRDAACEVVATVEDKPAITGSSMVGSLVTGGKVEPVASHDDVLSEKGTIHGETNDVPHPSEQEEATIKSKHDQLSSSTTALDECIQQHRPLPSIVDGSGEHVLPAVDAKFHVQDSRMGIDTGAKKAKFLKRPGGELNAKRSALGEKKKKRKKESGNEMPSEMGKTELKLPQLMANLQALACNPFDGVEGNSSAITLQAFLRFRSVVYRKSLALFSPADMDLEEAQASKSTAGSAANPNPRENIKDLPTSRALKPPLRSDDPTKGGRKRGPSDRQEELATKRLKKIKDMKSLAAEKRAVQKPPEEQRDGKETVTARPPKLLKLDSGKRSEPQARTPEPTMLVMKFPPNTNLPSGSELKARLARFGPLDHSSTRIFWKTSTCRVVFIYKANAEAALRHLTGNNTLFGNVNMRCHIRPLEATAPESDGKAQRQEGPPETLQLRDSTAGPRPPAAAPGQQPVGQLKSCLKKPAADEAGTASNGGSGGGSGGTPRVKFLLVEKESSGGDKLMIGNKSNFNKASFADGNSSSSSYKMMDSISKNFQKVIPSLASPVLPLPRPLPPSTVQISNAPPRINLHYAEASPRNTHNLNHNVAWPSETKVDIAHQMLSLLTKCNDVVTHLRSTLGYVPYHPL